MQISDPWAALQLDNAVTFVGSVVENAAQEMEKVGPDDKPEWKAKYTMQELLDQDFRLPLPDGAEAADHFERQLGRQNIGGLIYDEVGE